MQRTETRRRQTPRTNRAELREQGKQAKVEAATAKRSSDAAPPTAALTNPSALSAVGAQRFGTTSIGAHLDARPLPALSPRLQGAPTFIESEVKLPLTPARSLSDADVAHITATLAALAADPEGCEKIFGRGWQLRALPVVTEPPTQYFDTPDLKLTGAGVRVRRTDAAAAKVTVTIPGRSAGSTIEMEQAVGPDMRLGDALAGFRPELNHLNLAHSLEVAPVLEISAEHYPYTLENVDPASEHFGMIVELSLATVHERSTTAAGRDARSSSFLDATATAADSAALSKLAERVRDLLGLPKAHTAQKSLAAAKLL